MAEKPEEVAVRDASEPSELGKRTLSSTRNARYNQRKPPLQVELDSAARLFRRQLGKAQEGQRPTLAPAGKRATKPPRRWCLVASLFGGASCHPMYVLGALRLASELPIPWSLWLAVDESTLAAWEHLLSAAPNVHIVVVRRAEQLVKGKRVKGTWAVNTFTRFLLLDDNSLAGAVVIDLDVYGQAAASALKLWRAADAAAADDHNAAYGVVSYPVGSRGMAGRTTTWNAGAVAVAKRQAGPLGFADSISAFIGDRRDWEYGCDEAWLGSASPVFATYRTCAGDAVLEVDDTCTDMLPVVPGAPRRPQLSTFGVHDVAITRIPDKKACLEEAAAMADQLQNQPDTTHLRSVHELLSCPASNAVAVDWVCDGAGRFDCLI